MNILDHVGPCYMDLEFRIHYSYFWRC